MRPMGNQRAGFTLLETLISLVLFAIVMSSAGLLGDSITESYSTIRTTNELEAEARRTVEEIAARLSTASAAEITPFAVGPLYVSTVDFRGVVGFTGGTPDWSDLERISFEVGPDDADDGVDNDGDGLVDERRVVWIRKPGQPDERRTVLCRDVPKWFEGEIPGNGLDDNGNGLVDEMGLAFDFAEGFPDERRYVRILLSLETRDGEGRPITTTVERFVSFRNQETVGP